LRRTISRRGPYFGKPEENPNDGGGDGGRGGVKMPGPWKKMRPFDLPQISFLDSFQSVQRQFGIT
jgi:hypothetical protein